MTGQGSPKFEFSFCAVNPIVLALISALFFVNQTNVSSARSQEFYPLRSASDAKNNSPVSNNRPFEFAAAKNNSPVAAPTRDLRLRLSWGGGSPQAWTGSILVTNGAFSNVTPLGLSEDANAAVMKVGESVQVKHWTPTNYGGADITLSGTSETQVSIELSSAEQPESRFERTISFDELVSGAIGGDLDLLGNRCSITRVPGDQIKVSFERKHLVFKPGELFTFSITPSSTGLSDRAANCRIKVVSTHSTGLTANRALVSKSLPFQMDETGSAGPQEISLNVPMEEAAYNIELEMETNRYQSSFGSKKNLIRRTVQMLVLAEKPKEPNTKPWKQVASIDPADTFQDSFSAWSQLSRISLLPNKEALGNELRSTVEIGERTMMQLAPGGWQAIPIAVDQIGKPHVVEVEYVANGEIAMGVSLLQPDASGQIPPFGFDSGVYVPNSLVSDAAGTKIRTHHLTVWPQTKTPYLLLANRHATENATIGVIKVFAGADRLDPSTTSQLPSENTRRLMAFYELPLFSENFGAREQVDPEVGEPLDDWRMFHEGAERFIEYLKANSFRGAFVTVACEGSSIYPSQLLLPSPKYDNGIFFSNGQDPVRKDILEMLFRMFEREGLVLVPTLALSGPLPEVEQLRKRDGSTSDFELVDLNGSRRALAMSDRLPVYNPLNRTVQRAVRRIVEELADRYKTRESFDGVAVVCRPDTFTLLPGRQWGYDSATVQQFMQTQSDLGQVPQKWTDVQKILLGSHRKPWINWRAAQMTAWYQDLAAELERARPDSRLYLAPVDLYRNEETASALSPSLHASTDFDQVMLHLGFESDLVQSKSNAGKIVFMNPHRIALDQPLSSQRVDLAVENSKQAQQYFANLEYSADLFTHRTSWAHFAQLQAQSPFGKQRSALMRLQQMSPSGSYNRIRFVQSIKDRDSRLLVDGGKLMMMGQEESLIEMMSVYSQLPDARFDEVNSKEYPNLNSRPVAVRQLEADDQLYFYVANASPWPTQVRVLLQSESASKPTIESLSNQMITVNAVETTQLASTSNANRNRRTFEVMVHVPAYGLVGGRMPRGNSMYDFGFELPPNAGKELRRHIYGLQAKLTKSANPKPLDVLENSKFEVNGQPTLVGWDTGQQSSGKVRLDLNQESNEQMGSASLLIANEDQSPVWVRSNVFATTGTGRISISVWLKTTDAENQPPLRLALEGQSNGTSYYRFGSVGSLSNHSGANQIESRWKRFAVHFDDLPADGLTNVRIGFDLMGPGQVNIDNVKIFDRWFDENDAMAITQMLASSAPLLSEPATFDSCRRLLNGYWPMFLDKFIDIEETTNPPREYEARTTDTGSTDPGRAKTESEPAAENEAGTTSNSGERKVPMFRRIRNLVPQRQPATR